MIGGRSAIEDILISKNYSNDHLGTTKFYSVLAKYVENQWGDPNISTRFLFSFPRAKYRFLSQESYLGEWIVPPMTTIVAFIKETLNYINDNYKRYCDGLPPLGRYLIVDHSMPWWTHDSENVDVSIQLQENEASTDHGTMIVGKERVVSLDSYSTRTREKTSHIETKQSVKRGEALSRTNRGEILSQFLHGFHGISPSVVPAAVPETEGESYPIEESPLQPIVSSISNDTVKPVVESNRPFKKRNFRLEFSDTVQHVGPSSPLHARRADCMNDEHQQTRTPHIVPRSQVRTIDNPANSVDDSPLPISAIGSPHRLQQMEYEFQGVQHSISNPSDADVLLFGQCHGHPGNKRLYSAILSQLQLRPLDSPQDMRFAVMDVIHTISCASGRFLARDHYGYWQTVDKSVVQQYVLRGVVYISNRHFSQQSGQSSYSLPSARVAIAKRNQVKSLTFRMNCIGKERNIMPQSTRSPRPWIPEATSSPSTSDENVVSLSPQAREETLNPTLVFRKSTQLLPVELPCLPIAQLPLVACHMRPDEYYSSGGLTFPPPHQEQHRVDLVQDSTMVQQLVDHHSVSSTTTRNEPKKAAKSAEE